MKREDIEVGQRVRVVATTREGRRDEIMALLTIEEVSAEIKKPVKTLYNWRHLKVGPRSIKVGRSVRYRREDLDAWLAGLVRSGVGDQTGVVVSIDPTPHFPFVVDIDLPQQDVFNAGELELLEPVAPVIDWQARAERAEADADRLAEALRVCATDAERSTPAHGDDIQWRIKVAQPMVASALKAHDEAAAQR